MGRLLARNFSGPSLFCSGTYIQVPDNLKDGAILDTMTFMAWINTGNSPSYSVIETSSGNAYGLRYTDNKQLSFYYNGTSLGGVSQTFVQGRKWAHCVATYDRISGVTKFYINGVLVYSTTNSVASAAPTSAYRVSHGYAYLTGNIAEPAVFNRVLTAEEIRNIYEQGPSAYPKDGSCVLDYRFKEGAIDGAQIVDSSGKGNHGTLTLSSGRIDPYNIPVPNRVLIPGNMPLVAVESTGATTISVSDALIAAAFGVAAGQVGVNGLSVGSWVKNKKYAVQPYFASKGSYNNYGSYLSMSSSKAFTVTSNGSGTNYLLTVNQIAQVSWNNLAAINGIDHYKAAVNGLLNKKQYVSLVGHGAVNFSIISSASGNITTIALPFIANRVLTDEEIYNIYNKATFPADVLFWHGADSTGTKIMCHKGSYGNRPAEVATCDATLGTGNYFTDDCPWR